MLPQSPETAKDYSRFLPELGLLDDEKAMERIDHGNMRAMISSFPTLVRDALALSQKIVFPDSYREVEEIVVCGMGGSAIGGDLFRDLSSRIIPVNVSVVREYDMPKHV
ncbi:MAG: hypothetical protein QXU09_00700, partial [Thermoproteota archaeon]